MTLSEALNTASLPLNYQLSESIVTVFYELFWIWMSTHNKGMLIILS